MPDKKTKHIHPGNPSLSTRQMAMYCRQIVHRLKTDKKYRIPDYSLWELSRDTKISSRIISKSINKYMGQNFYELINRMRIEEAKNILQETSASGQQLLLKNVYQQCGFHSRSAFFSHFSQYEGITPKKYSELCSGKNGTTTQKQILQKTDESE